MAHSVQSWWCCHVSCASNDTQLQKVLDLLAKLKTQA